MRDFLQMTDPLSFKLGAKVEKPKEQTAEQEAQELRELARVVFEALPHNICGQPDVGQLFQRKPVEPDQPKADAHGWVEWREGMQIPDGQKFDFRLRTGETFLAHKRPNPGAWSFGVWGEATIAAYRVIG